MYCKFSSGFSIHLSSTITPSSWVWIPLSSRSSKSCSYLKMNWKRFWGRAIPRTWPSFSYFLGIFIIKLDVFWHLRFRILPIRLILFSSTELNSRRSDMTNNIYSSSRDNVINALSMANGMIPSLYIFQLLNKSSPVVFNKWKTIWRNR